MEFGLSDDQKMLEDSLRGFLAGKLSLDRLRKIAEIGQGFDLELWTGLVRQGIAGLVVAERYGGVGLSMLDAAVVAESLGYHAVPAPFAASVVMAPLALMLNGTGNQQSEWLPRIAGGEVRMGLGFAGGSGQTGEATARLDGGHLSGQSPEPSTVEARRTSWCIWPTGVPLSSMPAKPGSRPRCIAVSTARGL
jgi:alkylation response protein AidB-like acyl-CoA dehydrogenase